MLRHAIAFDRDRRRWPDDAPRPLTPAAKQRFRKAAQGLRNWMPRVDAVLSSPLVRARQTANLLSEVCGWPAVSDCSALVPGTPSTRLLAYLRTMRGGASPSLGTSLTSALSSHSA